MNLLTPSDRVRRRFQKTQSLTYFSLWAAPVNPKDNGFPRERAPLHELPDKTVVSMLKIVSRKSYLTFDLSAHDTFMTWQSGACVCCPSRKQLIKPVACLTDTRLTVWFSVPLMV